MILYSKDSITSAVASMKRNDRMAHGFLLQGEKGAGKKTTALYIAKTLMCESCVDGVPCGSCRHCRRVEQGTHPDVIIPERSGKMMIYNVETIEDMYEDAYVMPNDCDCKVYILPDCENIQERTQNMMLKLIEEPPSHAYFIFTARDKSVFLPTILSRVITFGVPECKEGECAEALAQHEKYTPEQINEAVSVFHGNIGCCMEYLEGAGCAEEVKLCRSLIDGIISGDEYTLYKSLYDMGENREKIKNVLTLADKVIRDVCIIRIEGRDKAELTGCYKSGAERLADRLSFKKAENIHEILLQNIQYCSSNVNVSAAMAALSGELVG